MQVDALIVAAGPVGWLAGGLVGTWAGAELARKISEHLNRGTAALDRADVVMQRAERLLAAARS